MPATAVPPIPVSLHGLEVNLLGWANGVGLSRDLDLLHDVLTQAGCAVTITAFDRSRSHAWHRPRLLKARRTWSWLRNRVNDPRFDLNIMVEHLRPGWLNLARHNAFLPNPEWFAPRKVAQLKGIHTVLCKTRHAQAIFDGLGCFTAQLGFTNDDRYRPEVVREPAFFHLAGKSPLKGTARLLDVWERHPEWPTLTIVQHPDRATRRTRAANVDHRMGYLPEAELITLQNANRFHLCPSETEGFGHYLVEAMAVGAVVLTLDAAPMNELVTPERGVLVPAGPGRPQGLATAHAMDEEALEATIHRVLGWPDARLHALGAQARAWYEANDAAFRLTLPQVVGQLCGRSGR